MRNDSNVAEGLRLANMDLDTAQNVFGNMYPKPCEIICYHCQQATEKFLKALALANDQEPLRTHDLVVLAKSLGGCVQIPLSILRMCAMSNPYGVKVRYLQDMAVGIQDARAALEYSQEIKKCADALIGV